jgi:adenine-specific DNA-methyltransferase
MTQTYLRSLLDRLDEVDTALGRELRKETKRIADAQSYGLVFEHHIPETVELPGRAIRRGLKVRIDGPDKRIWLVTRVKTVEGQRVAELLSVRDPNVTCTRPTGQLTVVADFGDPIYPGLRSLGRIERGGDKPYHLVINAENFHALGALLYPYRGRIDCVYIDPPYNSGEEAWIYNDRYVDVDDQFADSMWLSMMNRRLRIAKELLTKDGVLAVHINEHEVNNLGVLLRQIFPRARLNMVTVRVAGSGMVRDGLNRVDEQVFLAFFGSASPCPIRSLVGEQEKRPTLWRSLSAVGHQNGRPQRSPSIVYPIFVDRATHAIVGTGLNLTERLERGEIEAIYNEMAPPAVPEAPEGAAVVWPIKDKTNELFGWRLRAKTLMEQWRAGHVKVTRAQRSVAGGEYSIRYLAEGTVKMIETGAVAIVGRGDKAIPTVTLQYVGGAKSLPTTMWSTPSHSTAQGGASLAQLFGYKPFNYPKSPYLAYDLLSVMVGNKPNALVLDYFAGSGTTQHALAMLNAGDGGRRTSIMVTNNQVDKKTDRALRKRRVLPLTAEYEAAGIFERTTRPRVTYAMTGGRDSAAIEAEYLAVGGDDPRPIAEGFPENVEFLELTYQDPEAVRLNMAFSGIAPLLWMRAGAQGDRIDERCGDYAVTDRYGVLFNPDKWKGFCDAMRGLADARCAFVITDSEATYQAVVRALPAGIEPIQLYDSYLTTFVGNGWEM